MYLRADEWILDYDAAVEAAAKPLGDKEPDFRERMERLRALAIYCDCVQPPRKRARAAAAAGSGESEAWGFTSDGDGTPKKRVV